MSIVAILGAGPAGMMTAWAAERNGHEPRLFALFPGQSAVNDDMFLQKPIPGIHDPADPDVRINYLSFGTSHGYAKKVYGDAGAPVSWGSVLWGQQPAWWLKPTYDLLWDRYSPYITSLVIASEGAEIIAANHPIAISTLPATTLCGKPDEHKFVERQTWLRRDESSPDQRAELVYNGEIDTPWFRHSCLNGWSTWEYSEVYLASSSELVFPGKKMVSNTCDCHPGIARVGRWAQWTRGVLNHHAFEQATALLASSGLGKGV